MADINFSEFQYDSVSTDNFLVGYNPSANFEIKTKISDIINTAVNTVSSTSLVRDNNGIYMTTNNSLSTNGVDTFLKIKNIDNGNIYGLKVQLIG